MKEARDRTGLKQKGLAKRCELGESGQSTVSNWEHDKQFPEAGHLETLLDILGLELGECLYFPDEVGIHKRIEAVIMAGLRIEKDDPKSVIGKARGIRSSKSQVPVRGRRKLDKFLAESSLCKSCRENLRQANAPRRKRESDGNNYGVS